MLISEKQLYLHCKLNFFLLSPPPPMQINGTKREKERFRKGEGEGAFTDRDGGAAMSAVRDGPQVNIGESSQKETSFKEHLLLTS